MKYTKQEICEVLRGKRIQATHDEIERMLNEMADCIEDASFAHGTWAKITISGIDMRVCSGCKHVFVASKMEGWKGCPFCLSRNEVEELPVE